MSVVAIMQPYFVPYAGYFRLFAAADVLVVLDSVQFSRRGWVHRNRLLNREGRLAWLTLPLRKGPVETRIADLEFTNDARSRLEARLRRFPVFASPRAESHPLVRCLTELAGRPVPYLERLLRECCSLMGLPFDTVRASEIEGSEGLRGQDLVIRIAQRLGASVYVNLAGARTLGLYDEREFRRHGVKLRFLSDYRGSDESVLGRILSGPVEPIRRELLANV